MIRADIGALARMDREEFPSLHELFPVQPCESFGRHRSGDRKD